MNPGKVSLRHVIQGVDNAMPESEWRACGFGRPRQEERRGTLPLSGEVEKKAITGIEQLIGLSAKPGAAWACGLSNGDNSICQAGGRVLGRHLTLMRTCDQ